MQTLTIGPEHGSLTLHTGVEGKAAKAGHALTLAVGDWSATVDLADTGPTAVSLRAAVDSIEVVSGHGGLKPLSEKDKRSVRSSALETLSATMHPEVTFRSSSVTATRSGYDLVGDVVLCGETGPVRIDLGVQRGDGTATVDAVVPIEQTGFGITPYTGMFGALRVSDRVEIRLSVTVAIS